MTSAEEEAEAEFLRERLTFIMEQTAGAAGLEPAGFWVGGKGVNGGKASKLRVKHNMSRGRIAWHKAHVHARKGLAALALKDIELAKAFWRSAEGLYIAAFEARLRPADLADLSRSAAPQARPPETERNRRLAAAVDLQIAAADTEGRSVSQKTAIAEALRADPALAAEFKGRSGSAVDRAYDAGKKTNSRV